MQSGYERPAAVSSDGFETVVARRGPVAVALDKMLAGMELDDAGEARAAIARALATKLDESVADSHATAGMATAPLAKELREVVDAILEATGADGLFVADLFAPVGDR